MACERYSYRLCFGIIMAGAIGSWLIVAGLAALVAWIV